MSGFSHEGFALPTILLKRQSMQQTAIIPQTIAFIGLGVMGAPMAGHLLAVGHRVIAYNRTRDRAENWREGQRDKGLEPMLAETPAQAASTADIIITCVGNDQDLHDVTLGENGAFRAIGKNRLYIDHTTVSAGMARRLAAEAVERGFSAVDAPVSGGQAGAENGRLAIMCGGDARAVEAARTAMQAYGARIVHVGPAGAGQTAKMANQMCIAGVLGGLSEAIRLTQAAGLDTDAVFQAISGGAAQSWQMENRWATMVQGQFDFGFAVDWMRKDLGYALEEAERLGLSAPVTKLVDQFYAEIQEMGGGRQDTSSLIRRLPKGSQ